MDLFESIPTKDLPGTPLPERMRPDSLSEIKGQAEVLAQLQRFLSGKYLPNLIFWGPPGTGKTTAAQLLAKASGLYFLPINATSSGAKELRELGEAAKHRRLERQERTLLFVDEIHRFNKSQQDVLLPYIEKGELTLVGATTENPSYELNRALLSRCRLIVFSRLSESALQAVLTEACAKSRKNLDGLFQWQALAWFLSWSDGDARRALTALEGLLNLPPEFYPLALENLQKELGSLVLGHDKASDQHYDLISAFIKSVRGSDADAGLYYLARMLKGGEDPLFIARRLVILASEDVGNADPRALQVAISGAQAVEMIGLPEGAINLAQVVCYLASAPKSNRSYLGLKRAQDFVESSGSLPVPLSLRSAKTEAMKALGYGKDYVYPHDQAKHFTAQNYLPERVHSALPFYEPDDIGFEKQIREFANWLRCK